MRIRFLLKRTERGSFLRRENSRATRSTHRRSRARFIWPSKAKRAQNEASFLAPRRHSRIRAANICRAPSETETEMPCLRLSRGDSVFADEAFGEVLTPIRIRRHDAVIGSHLRMRLGIGAGRHLAALDRMG